jgi:dTDP-glucose 4,6-dehydratase
VADNPRYSFAHLDICDAGGVMALLKAERPDAILHLAAESHVDRSMFRPMKSMAPSVLRGDKEE